MTHIRAECLELDEMTEVINILELLKSPKLERVVLNGLKKLKSK